MILFVWKDSQMEYSLIVMTYTAVGSAKYGQSIAK